MAGGVLPKLTKSAGDGPGLDEFTSRLSQSVIRALVGQSSFARGQAYARDGHVLSTEWTQSRGWGWHIMAGVAGTRPRPYTVRVAWSERSRAFVNTCSCPLGGDCKHVAAVLLSSLETPKPGLVLMGDGRWIEITSPAQLQGADAAAVAARRPSWSDALAPLCEDSDLAGLPPALALQFDVKRAKDGTVRIGMRPVIRGSSRGWIRTGISWATLRYHAPDEALSAHVELLMEMHGLAKGESISGYGYGYSNPAISLNDCASKRIWNVLSEAVSAGLPFVTSDTPAQTVSLSLDPLPSPSTPADVTMQSIWRPPSRQAPLAFLPPHSSLATQHTELPGPMKPAG